MFTRPWQPEGMPEEREAEMSATRTRYAALFPGQGSQFEGMADPWTEHPAGKGVLDEASDSMGRDVVAGCHDETSLATTEFVQPALLVCDVAAFRVMEAEGISFAGVAGHSLGEFAALVAAGVVPLGDALDLVVVRGAAMQRAGEERPGTMTALLGVGSEDAATLCDEARDDDVLVVANENSPAQAVISGSVPAIERAETLAKGRRVRAIRLNVAGAFHSPLMEPAVEPFRTAVEAIRIAEPRVPVYSCVTAEPFDDVRERLVEAITRPVRWLDVMRALEARGVTDFVETGPGRVLTNLVKKSLAMEAAGA